MEEKEETPVTAEFPEEELKGEGKEARKKGRAKREKKEVVRKRKSQKERENPLSAALRLSVESGEVELGSKSSIRDLLLGKTKMAVLAKNAPRTVREDLLKYGKLSQIPVLEYPGTSIELGSVCGRPFPVIALSVRKEGVSNILDFAKKK